MGEPTVICNCMGVTDQDIEDAVISGDRTFEEVQERTQASTGCGQCEDDVRALVEKYVEQHS